MPPIFTTTPIVGLLASAQAVPRNADPSSAETALADEMMDYWVRFAATDDPNGPGAAQWVPYDAGENILQLDDSIVTVAGGYRNPQCDFLSTLPIRY